MQEIKASKPNLKKGSRKKSSAIKRVSQKIIDPKSESSQPKLKTKALNSQNLSELQQKRINQKIIQELTKLSFRNETALVTKVLNIQNLSEVNATLLQNLQQIEVNQTSNGFKIKVKFCDKLEAIKLLNEIANTKNDTISSKEKPTAQVSLNMLED